MVGIGLLTDNPAADVKKPRGAKSVHILEPEQMARLRAALSVPWERLLVELTIVTGLRSGEVRGLVWDDDSADRMAEPVGAHELWKHCGNIRLRRT